MTTVDGLKISTGLVGSLKNLGYISFGQTKLVSFSESLMSINDYLIDKLTNESPEDIEEIKKISSLLVEMKYIRDSITDLNNNLIECLPDEER